MSSIASCTVKIQTSPQSVPSIPSWIGEVVLVAHYLRSLGLLEKIALEVRFSRKRFGTYEVIDFVAVLIGYALSGEAGKARLLLNQLNAAAGNSYISPVLFAQLSLGLGEADVRHVS